MVNVDIDRDLYNDIKQSIRKYKYHYPSIKFFVQRAIYNELLISKSRFDKDIEKPYSQLKEFIEQHPELKSKIDEAYAAEVKKAKRVAVR